MLELATALTLIILHGPEHQEVDVITNKISSLRTPQVKGHLHEEIHCVVHMTNGNFIGVEESCRKVHELILDSFK